MNVYYRAAAVIERYGWTRYVYGSESLGFCLIGALLESTEKDDEFEELKKVLDGHEIVYANDTLIGSSTEAVIALTLAGIERDKNPKVG